MTVSEKQVIHYTSEEIADLLDNTNWSREFTWEQIKRMSQYFKVYGAEAKQVLFRQGEADKTMGILLKGSLKVVKTSKEHKQVIATLRAPHTFGEIALIDGQPRSAHIIAATDAEFIMVTKLGMDKMAKEHPIVAYQLLWKIAFILSQRVRSTTEQLAEEREDHGQALPK